MRTYYRNERERRKVGVRYTSITTVRTERERESRESTSRASPPAGNSRRAETHTEHATYLHTRSVAGPSSRSVMRIVVVELPLQLIVAHLGCRQRISRAPRSGHRRVYTRIQLRQTRSCGTHAKRRVRRSGRRCKSSAAGRSNPPSVHRRRVRDRNGQRLETSTAATRRRRNVWCGASAEAAASAATHPSPIAATRPQVRAPLVCRESSAAHFFDQRKRCGSAAMVVLRYRREARHPSVDRCLLRALERPVAFILSSSSRSRASRSYRNVRTALNACAESTGVLH